VAGARKVGWLEAPEAFAVVELLTAGSTLSDGAGADDGEGAGYSGSWMAFALLSRRGGERFCKPCGPRCDSGVERAILVHTKRQRIKAEKRNGAGVGHRHRRVEALKRDSFRQSRARRDGSSPLVVKVQARHAPASM